jgi:hypothetical protein
VLYSEKAALAIGHLPASTGQGKTDGGAADARADNYGIPMNIRHSVS